jgi:hypothetical protein
MSEEIGIVRYYVYGDGETLSWVQSTADMAPTVKLHWRQREVILTPAPEGTSDIAGTEEFDVLQRAVDRWMSLTCEGPTLVVGEPAAGTRARYDSVNRVIYRHDSWDNEFRCNKTEPTVYDPSAIALTTLCYGTQSGEIYDADIEINGIDQPMGVCTDAGVCTSDDPEASDIYDLESVLTHELGHFIGLDHTCWTPNGSSTRPVDHEGVPVALCGPDNGVEILEATMYPKANSNDVSLRTLLADDQEGFCGIYAGNNWRDDESGCGCRVGGAAGPDLGGGIALVIGLLGLVAVTRRSRR